MALEPTNWNVVVLGRWNRAILTPAGIAGRLFELEEETAVEVLVAIDALAPPQVRHLGMTVVAGTDRLVVQPNESQFPELDRARQIGIRAIEKLPETPFSAVGFNVRYQASEPIGPLIEILQHESDGRLADVGLETVGRLHKRTVEWKTGVVNISVEQKSENTVVLFNFESVSSNKEELTNWLKTPIADVESTTDALLNTYLAL